MKTRNKLTAALAVSLLALTAVNAQQSRDQMQAPRTGTATLAGVITTDDPSPQPLKRVQVTVVAAEIQFSKTTYTNDSGRFSLAALPAGRYTLAATKAPYLRMSYGARRHDRPGTPITLKEGQQINDIAVRMTRGAVLGGVITDENGQPAFGVQVRVMQARMQNGERTFVNVTTANALGETTDDRGNYRFYGLPPGDYVVTATPRLMAGEVKAMTDAEIRSILQALQQQQAAAQQNAQPGVGAPPPTPTPKPETETVTVGYAGVYYPGTTVAASASTVTIATGEERLGIDFPLKLVRTAKLEGQVIVPAGIRPQGVQLMLSATATPGQGTGGLEMFTLNRAPVDAEGKFAFTAVPPGQYTIVARATAGAPGAPPPPPPPPPPPGGGQGVIQFQQIRVAGAEGGALPAAPMMLFADGAGDPNGQVYWGQVDVTVDGTPLTGLTVSMQPGMTVTGKIAFKATRLTPETDLSRVRVMLTPAPAAGAARISLGIPMAQVDANGNFKISGVTPGRYRMSGAVPVPPGAGPGLNWSLFSAVVKGVDALDFPIDIGPNDELKDVVVTFADVSQEVNGSLQDASGRAAPDYTIVVFGADNRYWTSPTRRVRSTRPGTDGRFTISNLPPGEYRIAALTDVAPGDLNDPAFLEQLVAASVKFTLAEGERKTQDLRIAGGL